MELALGSLPTENPEPQKDDSTPKEEAPKQPEPEEEKINNNKQPKKTVKPKTQGTDGKKTQFSTNKKYQNVKPKVFSSNKKNDKKKGEKSAQSQKEIKTSRNVKKDKNVSMSLKESSPNRNKKSVKNEKKNLRQKTVEREHKDRAIKTKLFSEDAKPNKATFSPKAIKGNSSFAHRKNKEKELPRNLSKELLRKHQEHIDYSKKYDYLKRRIEALKIQEEIIKHNKKILWKNTKKSKKMK